MKGGWGVQILGFCIHFSLAFIYTLFYFVVHPKLRLGQYNKYAIGFMYMDFLVGMFMTFVVIPMTRLPHKPLIGYIPSKDG